MYGGQTATLASARCVGVDGAGRSVFVVVGGNKRSCLGRRSARSGKGTEEEQAICNIRFGSPVQYSLGAGPEEIKGGDGGEEQAR